MANPLVPQGTLNRLRASLTWADFPALNVTSPYLTRRGINLSFSGEATVYIDSMTGAVTSPEPYVRVAVALHIVKTLPLANAYKLQLEQSTLLGDCTLRPDSSAMTPWNLVNCAIMGASDMSMAGDDAEYQVRIGGIYYVNSALFIG